MRPTDWRTPSSHAGESARRYSVPSDPRRTDVALATAGPDRQPPRERDFLVGQRRFADDFRHHRRHDLIGLDHSSIVTDDLPMKLAHRDGRSAVGESAIAAWRGRCTLSGSAGGRTREVRGPRHRPEAAGAYAVNTADFNNDGKLDVIANSLGARELAWYENPTWERHVIVSGHDADREPGACRHQRRRHSRDRVPELASPCRPAKSDGVNWIARSQGPGQAVEGRRSSTRSRPSHHVRLGRSRRRRQEGTDQRAADRAREPRARPTIRTRRRCSGTTRAAGSVTPSPMSIPGIIHRVRPVKWDSGNREQMLVASFEGIVMYRAHRQRGGDEVREGRAVEGPRREGAAPRRERRRRRHAGRQAHSSPPSSRGTATKCVVYTGSGTTGRGG